MSAAQAQNPFAFAAPPAQYSQPPQQQPPQQPQQQLVVATQPSNPYAGMVAPQQPPQQPQASPWDAPAAAPTSSYSAPPPAAMTSSATSSASFDPFAAPPPPAPAPAPAYTPAPAPQQAPAYPAAPAPAIQDPWAAPAPAQSYSAPPPPQQSYQAPAPAPAPNDSYSGQPSSYDNNYGYGNDNDNNRQMVPANGGNNYDDSNYEQNKQLRNPYSQQLSQQAAASKASGLPKAELVGKKGYVLSRISFRTIVMKKWKQSFWVQYGGHTMLWFRNEQDFNDWLNNPYHTQMQRNFLIKLAINFVHDLYKPNVRGYQVTQCRTKPYGNNKVIRQFKLERWMDYGPTIAAAFGSYDSKEVDACREAIVECMKNTPLDNGIRATGAVKEHHERKQQEEWQKSQELQQGGQQNGGYNNYSMNGNDANGTNTMKGPRSNSVPDLLGDMNSGGGDDSASVPPGTYAPAPTGDLLGDMGSGALVPAVNPNAAYPGAPAPPVANSQPAFYPSSPPQMQRQQPQYPAQPPAAPYGAPAPQAYPGQQQQYQQQQAPQYQQAPAAPGFAQPPQPAGYGYQQPQATGGYPAASYPVPAQQF
eukprot:CAMPEP_0116127224 /NCGR_PEP_ID=MMETSP0329-20121206/6733_1 /TAXON_ID=697910 /ORGANISM="Pseudo-nitzschia arenysensis, Strain B593" /LENGTH=586 /DNA_ID=CAMNT_0003621323 /DNA_START=50 /DNA_END=1810 /DNA_ORIENTATION=+